MRPPEQVFSEKDLKECALLDVVCVDSDASTLAQTTHVGDTFVEEDESSEPRPSQALVLCFATTSQGHSVALTIHG